jgi:hypothetical protein
MRMLRMKRRTAAVVMGVMMIGASLVAAQAASANTTIGPGPASTFSEVETCGTQWANETATPKFIVSPQNFDGSYNVTLQLAIKFSTIAGQSPGACAPDTTGGTTLLNNIKGGGSGQLKFSVTGGTFDPGVPPLATCDANCYSSAVNYDMGPFTTAFFGDGATWTQAVPSILSTFNYQSPNTVLVHNLYHSLWNSGGFGYPPAFLATGDISID